MASIGEQTQSSPASFAPLAYPGDIVYLVYMLARLPGLSESVCCLLLSWQKEEKSVQWGIKCGDSQISSLLMVVFCPIMLPISSHPDSRRSRTKQEQKPEDRSRWGKESKFSEVKFERTTFCHTAQQKSLASDFIAGELSVRPRRCVVRTVVPINKWVLTQSLPPEVALCVWSCCGDRDRNTQTNINVTDRPHRPLLWNFYFTHHLKISHKCSAECISSYWGYRHMTVHYIYSIFLLLNQTAPLFPPELPKGDAILPLACLHYLFLRVEWCGFNPANRRDNSFFPGFTSSVYFRRGAYLTHSECSVCMRHAGNAAAVCWPLIPHQWRAVFLERWVWDERLFCKEVKVIIWKKLHWQWLEFTLPSSG